MKCPVCEHDLTEIGAESIKVDACKNGCGGIWFDHFELDKVDEEHEEDGEKLLDIETDPSITVDHEKRRSCPVCGDVIMMRHFYSVKRQVQVDECPKCGGYWLDVGELATLRRQFETEEERRKAAAECFGEQFDAELAQLAAARELEREKRRRIVNLFRFICPSYYIPGKQSWGAF